MFKTEGGDVVGYSSELSWELVLAGFCSKYERVIDSTNIQYYEAKWWQTPGRQYPDQSDECSGCASTRSGIPIGRTISGRELSSCPSSSQPFCAKLLTGAMSEGDTDCNENHNNFCSTLRLQYRTKTAVSRRDVNKPAVSKLCSQHKNISIDMREDNVC